jgi:hypothetical protein
MTKKRVLIANRGEIALRKELMKLITWEVLFPQKAIEILKP